ncbi:MAG: hypothetical protein HC869_10925 [Rhodospirillales bacterium]|nr:hypothetical protein [Rhodospirillales bacterium]
MSARRLLPRLLLLGGLAGVIVWTALNRNRLDLAALDAWLSALGVMAPLTYLGLYAVGTIAFLPGVFFALAIAEIDKARANLLRIAGRDRHDRDPGEEEVPG